MTKAKNYHYISPFNAYAFGAVEKRADKYWARVNAERNRNESKAITPMQTRRVPKPYA